MTILFQAGQGTAAITSDTLKKFEARVYQGAAGDTLPYRLLKPAAYDAGRAYPLVLFLHGAGEMGTDNRAQLSPGVFEFASEKIMKGYPCFVVAPQTNIRWVDVDWALDKHLAPAEPSKTLRMAVDLILKLEKEFNIDARRIYVTGLSMGGYGTWDLIARYPEMFAAAAPICGGGDETRAWRITEVPIWAFHGGQDTVVKTIRSRNMIAAVRKAGGDPKYTEYQGVGHDSWVKAYGDPELYKWMFAQHLR